MGEIRTVTTLRRKRDEVRRSIKLYEKRLFRYGEAFKLCAAALASGPMTTKELAVYVAKAKGLDATDTVMRRIMARHLIHSLRLRAKQGQLAIDGKRKGTIVWRLPQSAGTACNIER